MKRSRLAAGTTLSERPSWERQQLAQITPSASSPASATIFWRRAAKTRGGMGPFPTLARIAST